MAEIELRGIRKSFGGHGIIHGVDLEIERGEFLVLLGPSGCGKTTLLRLMAGLEQIDAGELWIAGRRANDLAPRDRDVAMVFQSYALYPHMSVRGNLAFGLAVRGTPPAEIAARVSEAASLLGLEGLLDRRPAALSGGQRQRVAMGRAIVRQPRIFLFDEPLSNLDAAMRVQMRGELARLHRRLGATMVYVTHDQVEAMTLATRIALFHKGALQQVGPPLELYHQPRNRFVASFIGSPPMNILEARMEGGRMVGRSFDLAGPAGVPEGEALIGVRPQELRVAPKGAFRGTVEALERLGSDGYAFVRTEDGLLAARFDERSPVSIGAEVQVDAPDGVCHIFSRDGARALHHPDRSRHPQGAK